MPTAIRRSIPVVPPRLLSCLLAVACLLIATGIHAAPRFVLESARKVPVAYDVDVVVVGGTTGAVAAAQEAARAGAKVFLAAPSPYLGEDMAATLRLWLEPGENPTDPLARALFAPARESAGLLQGTPLALKYRADLPSANKHKDTTPPSLLADGQWGSAYDQSVQYDGDVTITADLGRSRQAGKAYVMAYHYKDFQVESVQFAGSTDGKTWRDLGEAKCPTELQSGVRVPARPLAIDVGQTVRYVRFRVKRRGDSPRLLLGEIAVTSAAPAKPTSAPAFAPARPLDLKRTLDQALLDAKVDFLYSCTATDVLRDASGKVCGIVMANRAGRQAVRAKVVIDATQRAHVARRAGAKAAAYPPGPKQVRRVVIGGTPPREMLGATRTPCPPFRGTGRGYRNRGRSAGPFGVTEYTLSIPTADDSFAARARAEQVARDKTWQAGEQFSSDVLFLVPPDPIRSRAPHTGAWPGAESLDLGVCRPVGLDRVWVLGGSADVPRAAAAKLLRPPALIALGRRVGKAAARQAKDLPAPRGAAVTAPVQDGEDLGEVREVLVGVRPMQHLPTVPQPTRGLGVLGEYDVVVVGGGTAGAPAGISAARQGARTLVVEMLHSLGGVGTEGMISKYWYGWREGFCKEVAGGSSWSPQTKAEWWRTTLRKAGADVWFGAVGCGALVRDGKVRGAVITTPQGRGVVLAKVVIDATGNSDIAVAAGAATRYISAADIAMQGTGLPPRRLGATYTNSDFTITDETDLLDVWHLMVYARHKYPQAFDVAELVDTRERRRIVGDVTLTLLDQVAGRTWPDTIVKSYSNYDSHGYTSGDYFLCTAPPKPTHCYTPYRCLLPKGLDGILAAGVGLSARRDAMAFVRMQPCIQNQGYAAGAAAARAARKHNGATRAIDIRALQKHLVQIGNLPNSVLTDEDSFPVSDGRLGSAVRALADNYQDVAIVLAHAERARPLLRQAYRAAATDKSKLIYAHVLAVLGDAEGLGTLLAEVSGRQWSKAGGRARMNEFQRLIASLGRPRDRRATPVLLAKLRQLGPSHSVMQHRAMARALADLADPAAAAPLAELLAKPGMTGHAIHTVAEAQKRELEATRGAGSKFTFTLRNDAFRELLLARALLACGDPTGLARKILQSYSTDLRGHLRRHALLLRKQAASGGKE